MDFREEAIRESLAAAGGSSALPTEPDRSLCVPVEPDGAGALVRASWTDLAIILGSLVGVIPLAALVILLPVPWTREVNIAAGTTLMLSGPLLVAHHGILRRWHLKRAVARRRDRLFDPDRGEVILVNIEDSATHDRTKVVPEDTGLCVLDATRRRLLIEGYACRYVIVGADIVRLEPRGVYAAAGVVLGYRVGETVLTITIDKRGMGVLGYAMLAYGSGIAAGAFHRRVAEALGLGARS